MNRYSTLKTRTPLRAKKPWNPVRKPLATRTALKANHPIRRVGKIGRVNGKARQEIAEIAREKNLKECEIGLDRCTKTWPLAPAHRHKRAWYKGDAKLLAHPKQWVCACQSCHDQIEVDPELTEEIFMKLRGPEDEDVEIIPEDIGIDY